MATLISKTTGNFTDSATWAVCDSTSELDSEAANTTLTTSYLSSSTFTPGAITIDGIAVRLQVRISSGIGTLSVALDQGGSTVTGTEVTIDVPDLPISPSGAVIGGWTFFKFSSPVTLAGATAYSVKMRTSSSSQIVAYRNATTNNWSRLLRTTTTQAPAATDKLVVVGEYTGQGTSSSFTVTMNNTASTTFGSVWVGGRGTLTWGTASSTAYYLKLGGSTVDAVSRGMEIHSNGVVNIGTSGARIPASSSAVLEFAVASNVQFGLEIRTPGTLNVYGVDRPNFWSLLTADRSAGGNTLTVSSTADWSVGDSLAIASTSRLYTEAEVVTIQSVDSATQVTLTGNVVNFHAGSTAPFQAEVLNLSLYNITIKGASGSLQSYINTGTHATVTFRSAIFQHLGSATTNKKGIDVAATGGVFDMEYCIFRDFEISGSRGISVTTNAGDGVSVRNCGFYRMAQGCLSSVSTTGLQTFENLVAITGSLNATSSDIPFSFGETRQGLVNNIRAAGSNSAGTIGQINITQQGGLNAKMGATFTNLRAHSSPGYGINLAGCVGGYFSNLTVWRTNSLGILCSGVRTILENVTSLGCTNTGLSIARGAAHCRVINLTSGGQSGYSTLYGITFQNADGTAGTSQNIMFENCSFGTGTGVEANTGADIHLQTSNPTASYPIVSAHNCLFGSSATFGFLNIALEGTAWLLSQRHNQTAGDHRAYTSEGVMTLDTSIFRSAGPSLRMTPNTASRKLISSPDGRGFKKAANNNETCVVSVWVRKSTGYNGEQPKLVLRRNIAMGIAEDTVIATASAGNDVWEQLTGTTTTVTDNGVLEFHVECGSTGYTTGWVNVDDFS
jgi:hypothetical protein